MRQLLHKENIILFLLLVCWSGCEIVNPADPVAVVLQIQPFTFTTSTEEGSASEKITEGWLYVNNEFLGSYTLPAEIPVIASGESEIIIFPGIRANGIKSTPDIYPFYAEYKMQENLTPGERYEINPTTQYNDAVKFSFIEPFEGTNILVTEEDGNTATKVVLDENMVFEGNSSARLSVSKENENLEVFTVTKYGDIPLDGRSVYIELNYKNDAPFTMGLVGSENGNSSFPNYFYIFKPQEDWNKIYIDLTEQIKVSGFPNYQIAFQVLQPPNAEQESHSVYMDNLKLVHF